MQKKLLVCDVEGTIFQATVRIKNTEYASTMFPTLAQKLGEKAIEEERLMNEKWERGEYANYIDWVDETYEMHKKYGLTKAKFDEVLKSVKYMKGVEEFFKNLDHSKYITAFISGGFQELIGVAERDFKIDYRQAACEYIFDPDNGLLAYCRPVPCDFEGKFKYIERLIEAYSLDPKRDWIFVGDGKNDCDIAKRAPIAFAINAHPDLKNVKNIYTGQKIYEVDDFDMIGKKISELEKLDFPLPRTGKTPEVFSPFVYDRSPRSYITDGFDRIKIPLIKIIGRTLRQQDKEWWPKYIYEPNKEGNPGILKTGNYDDLFGTLDEYLCFKIIKYNKSLFRSTMSYNEISLIGKLFETRNDDWAHEPGIPVSIEIADEALSNMAELMHEINPALENEILLIRRVMNAQCKKERQQ